MKDIHGDDIKENDLVCVSQNGRKSLYYIKNCWNAFGEEVFDTYRVTRDYHINKHDYAAMTPQPKSFQWTGNIERLPVPDKLREEVEDMNCMVHSPLEEYGEIVQFSEEKRRLGLFRAVKLINRKYAIIVNHYSERGTRLNNEFYYQRANLSLAELEKYWKKKKEQENCKWYSYGEAPGH